MPRLFISHAGENTAEAVAICDWLAREGWDDVFLDTDPERGIKAGEKWKKALKDAGNRCEAVLFLVSPFWLRSDACRAEFNLADYANKRLFGVVLEGIAIDDLPGWLTGEPQFVSVAKASDTTKFSVVLPHTGKTAEVEFAAEGLRRLKIGLQTARIDAKYFAWPLSDQNRAPYRGLPPLEVEDAGIFFGRDGPIAATLDSLRDLRNRAPHPEEEGPKGRESQDTGHHPERGRLLVILGASGSGKSSFLRAGLFPRLARDDRNFLPLPIVRPERAAISGETGLLAALEGAFEVAGITVTRADLRAAIQFGAVKLKPLLQALADNATPMASDTGVKPKPPALIISIDQGEELFLAEAQEQAQPFLALLRDLLIADAPAIIAVFTIRSDNYERLQLAKELQGVRQDMLSLAPMPKGSYAEVIKGPARRLDGTARALEIEDALVDALLADVEAGDAKDALPLLAFTLARLYGEYHHGGHLRLSHYEALGRVKGSIEAAVERALQAADADPAIPRDRLARLALLRRGLIPWLAGIDPDTGAPRRRVARLSEIPAEARPLIRHLVEQRLLATDVAQDTGEATIEPAHEALLRQWGLLEGWLKEDSGLLAVLEGVKRAGHDWGANAKNAAWLAHAADRLAAAERLSERPDLAANLEPTDRDYLAACRKAEADARRGKRLLRNAIYVLLGAIIVVLIGVIKHEFIATQWRYVTVTLPYWYAHVRGHVLTVAQEQALKPGDPFKECKSDCPEMIVIPAGSFLMGRPPTEKGYTTEDPQHPVTIAKPFAVSKYELTFADWDACVTGGGCNGYKPADQGWKGAKQPVINVDWDDAQAYVAWLSQVTGKTYRLLTEAEYEYATRAGMTTAYPWGDDIKLNGQAMANCNGCGSKWDNQQTAPVGSFYPNEFGLYDMVGNVLEWTKDCVHKNYNDAPADGSAWLQANGGDCTNRILRGGSWYLTPDGLRSASRGGSSTGSRSGILGFRLGRTLLTP